LINCLVNSVCLYIFLHIELIQLLIKVNITKFKFFVNVQIILQILKKDTVRDSVNKTEPRKPVPMMSIELDVNHLLLSCMTENSDNANNVDIRNDIPVETAEKIKF